MYRIYKVRIIEKELLSRIFYEIYNKEKQIFRFRFGNRRILDQCKSG